MRALYAGSDLHGNNNYLGIIDERGQRIFKKSLPNDRQLILDVLRPYKEEMAGIVVESTYNWYWLVDTLMDEGYRVHLANPSAIQQYTRLKHGDDKHDAFWLAEMLRLGILPEGYIYPKEERPVRDLLRKRSHLMRLRTSLVISLENMVIRNRCVRVSANEVKRLKEDRLTCLFEENEELWIILFLLAIKRALLYLIYKAFLETGIGFTPILLLPKSERLFQSFRLKSYYFFNSIGVILLEERLCKKTLSVCSKV